MILHQHHRSAREVAADLRPACCALGSWVRLLSLSLSLLSGRTAGLCSPQLPRQHIRTCDTGLSPESAWASPWQKDHQHLTPSSQGTRLGQVLQVRTEVCGSWSLCHSPAWLGRGDRGSCPSWSCARTAPPPHSVAAHKLICFILHEKNVVFFLLVYPGLTISQSCGIFIRG